MYARSEVTFLAVGHHCHFASNKLCCLLTSPHVCEHLVVEQIDLKLAVLVYKCLHGVAPSYLANELCQSADFSARRRLRSASSSSLVVHRTRLSTVSDRAFSVTAAHVWNGLQQHITSAPSLSTFRSRLKTHLFQRCFP